MRRSDASINSLIEDLDGAYGEDWLRLLEPFAVIHIADSIQMRTASGLERTRQQRIVDRLLQFRGNLPPILHLLDHTIARSGQRGRLPNIYLLTETGAAVLRARGFVNAHACNLSDDRAMTHALCMLDVNLSARTHGLAATTDRVVSFRDTETLRPDIQVTLQDGRVQIVEVEQTATRETVRRIADSLTQKQKFYTSPESDGYKREVRMVVNAQPGKAFIRTCRTWISVINELREDGDQPLNLTLLAIPMVDFAVDPEWDVEATHRWWDLTKPPQERHSSKEPAQVDLHARITEDSKEDLLLINALAQVMRAEEEYGWMLRMDLQFIDVMTVIYEASHPHDTHSHLWLMPPYASIALLSDYLEIHPTLHKRLRDSLHRGISRVSWSPRTIMHRMQLVVDAYLDYFGLRNSLRLSATVVAEDGEGRSFRVIVKSFGSMFGDYATTRRKMDALQWVLNALFVYAAELKLGRPRFF